MEDKDLSKGLRALTVEEERAEVLAVLNGKGDTMSLTAKIEGMAKGETLTVNGVTLRRSYDQKDYHKELDGTLTVKGMIAFVRVIAPVTHPNYESDLSVLGLTEWGII